jgi:hypothetical protein
MIPAMSERDRLLVRRWRAIMQEAEGLYNVDYSHQCLLERPSAIVRPFVCAPHFYGCRHCGQEHRCYLNPRECVAVVDGDAASMTCQYSGQVLPVTAPASWVGNHADQLIFEDSPGTCEQYLAAKEGVRYGLVKGKGRERPLYTNMRVRVPRGRRESIHKEKSHVEVPKKCLSKEVAVVVPTPVEEGETEMEVEDSDCEEGFTGDLSGYTEQHQSQTNEAYWDEYYSFLERDGLVVRAPPSQTPCVVAMPMEKEEERVEHFKYSILTEEALGELHEKTDLIVKSLLTLFLEDATTLHKSERRTLQERLVAYFETRIRNILLLVLNAPPLVRPLTPTQVCEALLLSLFLEAYCDEDQYGNRIEVWHACPWLRRLGETGLIGLLCGEVGRKTKKRKRREHYHCVKARVKEAADTLKHCLSHYKGNGFWLRDFIHSTVRS